MTDVKIDKFDAMRDNRDPRGVQWAIFPQTGRALYMIYAVRRDDVGKLVPDERYTIPEECAGEWTHSEKAQEAITRFLTRFWKESEESAIAEARRIREEKAKAAEEQARQPEQVVNEAPPKKVKRAAA